MSQLSAVYQLMRNLSAINHLMSKLSALIQLMSKLSAFNQQISQLSAVNQLMSQVSAINQLMRKLSAASQLDEQDVIYLSAGRSWWFFCSAARYGPCPFVLSRCSRSSAAANLAAVVFAAAVALVDPRWMLVYSSLAFLSGMSLLKKGKIMIYKKWGGGEIILMLKKNIFRSGIKTNQLFIGIIFICTEKIAIKFYKIV